MSAYLYKKLISWQNQRAQKCESITMQRQKGGDLTQSYDKSPYTHGNVKRAKWKHKQRHKKVRLNTT